MSRLNLQKRLGLAVAVLAFTAACSGSSKGPDVDPDAMGAPDAAVDPAPDAADEVADAAADAADEVADAAPDAADEAADAAPDAADEEADAAPDDAAPDGGTPTVDELTAVVALSNCSGSVVRFTTSQPTDHALVLTNGHCIGGGFLDPGEAIAGVASSRRMNVLEPDALVPGPPRGRPPETGVRVEVQASELLYATMTTSDMALYRLTITYGELEQDHGVYAMTITDHHPEAGTEILIPSGYWHALYSCAIDAFVYSLHEGGWTFLDSIRYATPGCETIGGTSGSPIVGAASHEVIGINNTGNENGTACSVNNPCEVDEAGNTVSVADADYGQQVYWLYGCLSPSRELDFTIPGCQLPAPTSGLSARGGRASRPEGTNYWIHPRAKARWAPATTP